MHMFALLLSLNFLILPTTTKPPKEKEVKIVKMKEVIAIIEFGGIYLYYPKTDLSEFIIQFTVNDVAVKFIAELDKNDKPVKLLVLGKRGTMPAKKIFFEKSDAKNEAFFDHAENLIKTFVREYRVREILKKYRKPPAPLTPNN